MPFSNPLAAGFELIRKSLRSDNYVTGVSGWTINRDGTAEFNGALFRGNVTITSGNDLLVYSTATPQANKLILAIAGSAGNDGLGNTWQQGLNIYDSAGVRIGTWNPTGGFTLTNDTSAGNINIAPTNAANKSPRIYIRSGGGVSSTDGFIEAFKSAGNQDIVFFTGPITTIDPDGSWVDMILIGGSGPGVPGDATGTLRWSANAGATIAPLATWTETGFHILIGDMKSLQPGVSAPPTQETWHAAALNAGYANAVGNNAPVGYQFEGVNGGRVRLRGVLNLTANKGAGSAIFALPTGYIPFFEQQFYVPNSLSGAGIGTGTIKVSVSGTVSHVPSGSTGNALYFDGIVLELD